MNTFKSIAVLIMLAVMIFMSMTACGLKESIKTVPPGGICENAPEDSVICKVFPNAERMNDIIVSVNTTAILGGFIEKSKALHAVDKFESKLNGLVTYASFVNSMFYMSGLIIIPDHIEKLKHYNNIIIPYDVGLLRALCYNMRRSINVIPDPGAV